MVLPTALAICAVAATQTDASLPTTITTRDGKTYSGVEMVRVDPDGILVNFQPTEGGYGFAKLKFRRLSDDLQKQYGYDEKKAADFENEQRQAAGRFVQARTTEETVVRYRNLAELNRSLLGDDATAYWIGVDTNGAVVMRSVVQNPQAQPVTVAPANLYTPMSNPQPTGNMEPLSEFESVP
jgi:hypothetical protein